MSKHQQGRWKKGEIKTFSSITSQTCSNVFTCGVCPCCGNPRVDEQMADWGGLCPLTMVAEQSTLQHSDKTMDMHPTSLPPPPPHHLPVLKDLLHSHYRWLSKTPVPNISKLPCHIVTNVLFSKHAHTKRRLLLQRQHDDSLLSCVSHWWSHIWAAALNQTVAWVATGDWRADFWAARQTSTWQISVWASYRLPPLWPLGAPLYTLLTLALTP